MTRSSIHFTHRVFTLLCRSRPVWIGLCLVLLGWAAGWAKSAPISSSPNESEAAQAYRQGMNLVKAGRIDEAIPALKSALRADPQSADVLNALGAAYSLKGDFEQAENYLIKALQADPGFVPARKNLAISYFDSGKYDLAITEFERLGQSPGNSRSVASLFLGIIAEKQGNFSKSASLLKECGGIVYQYPQALLSLAHSLMELDQVQKADAALKNLDTMSGVTASEYFKAGLLYSKQKQYPQALAELERASKADPSIPGLAYQRAVVLDQLGRPHEALQVLKDLTRSRPDGDSLNLMASVARQNGDLNLAIQSLRQAAALEPGREVNYLDFST